MKGIGIFVLGASLMGALAHADECSDLVTKIQTQADTCLAISKYEDRLACVKTIGANVQVSGTNFQACEAKLAPLKDKYIAKEAAKWGKKQSAFSEGAKGQGDGQGGGMHARNSSNGPMNGPNGGPNGTMNGPNGTMNGPNGTMNGKNGAMNGPNGNMQGGATLPVEVCKLQLPVVTSQADKCLGMAAFDARMNCFRNIGESLPPNFMDSCKSTLDPVKQQYIQKETAKYGKDKSAILAMDQGGGPNGPNQYGQNGPNGNNGPGGMAQFTPEQCKAQVPQLTKGADACITMKAFDARKSCFDKIGNSMPQGFFDACRPVVEPLKQAYMDKEHKLYPSQPSALENGGNGPNGPNGNNQYGQNGPNGQNGPMGGNMTQVSPEQCKAKLPEITKNADSCLKISSFDSRKACFDKIGNSYPPGFFDSCSSVFDPIRQSYQAKEHNLYPKQPSAMANNGGGPNNGPNNGPNAQNGPNGPNHMANVDCGKLVTKVTEMANKCLETKSDTARKACGDQVGSFVDQNGGDSCQSQIDALHQQIQDKEKQRYPSSVL